MDLGDDDLDGFLWRYDDACLEAGVEPLPVDGLVAVVEVMLAGTIHPLVTLH